MSRISLNQVESSERFYRVPKVFTDEDSYYYPMCLESKFAYGLLKDRFELSLQNGWVDEENNVYLIFTIKELEKVLGCKKDKVHQIKKELAQYGLLEEERQGLNKPNRLYVLNVDTTRTSEKPTSNEASDIKDIGNSDIRTSEKPTSRSRKNRCQDICNTDTNDTEYSETEKKEEEEEETPEKNTSSLTELETSQEELLVQEKLEALKLKYGEAASQMIDEAVFNTHQNLNNAAYYWPYLLKALDNAEVLFKLKQAETKAQQPKPKKKGIPNWFHPHYENHTTAEELAQLERIKRETLEKLAAQ